MIEKWRLWKRCLTENDLELCANEKVYMTKIWISVYMFSYCKVAEDKSRSIFYSKRLLFLDEHFSSPEESISFDLRLTNF